MSSTLLDSVLDKIHCTLKKEKAGTVYLMWKKHRLMFFIWLGSPEGGMRILTDYLVKILTNPKNKKEYIAKYNNNNNNSNKANQVK